MGKGQAFNGEGVRGVGRGRDKKQEATRQARTRSGAKKKKKNLIGIKCPDRVCGRVDSAKRAAFFFPLALVHARGKVGENKN